jgi:hypothetical protein
MKKRFHFPVTLPILIVLGSILFFLSVPYLFDLYLVPRLISKLPFTEKELSISRFSPWKIRGTLTLADEDRPTLSVPRFELYYTPHSLFRRKFSGLLLDSASLQLDMQNGHPVIRGLPDHDSPVTQEDNTSSFLLPLEVETITLKNCSLTLHRGLQNPITLIVDGRFSLDFLEQPENRKFLTTLSAQLQVRGDLAFTSELGLKSVDNGYDAHLQLQAPDIGQLLLLSPGFKDAQLTGGLSLDGKVNFDHSLSEVIDYRATVMLPGFLFRKNDFILKNSPAEKLITLQLNGNTRKTEYALANVVLAEPEKISLDLKGEVEILELLEPSEISEKKFNGIGHIFSERTNSVVTMNFNGSTQQAETRIDYELAGDAFNVDDIFSFSSFKGDGNIAIEGSTITANLRGLIPEITLKKSETTLVNLSLQLPFQYPLPATGEAGDIQIEEIRYQNINSGRLNATLLPSPAGINFTTLFTAPFVPGLRIACDGSTQMPANVSVHCRLPETHFDSATFPRSIALPEGLSVNGKLAAEGEFHITDKIPAGNLTVAYRDGTLSYNEYLLSNINAGVVFPHLPLLQSSPGQLCTIGSLAFGKIKMSDANIHFRIEDEQSIYLEKIRTNWCGGTLETGSFSLAGDMKELETTLYCNRLGFTELLAQFGIDQAEGEGSLNGRLPMIINKNGVVFEDGFLFSTPGNSGIVRFNDTSRLRQGMPDMGASAYLDYSMKALENFSYNWTKLTFNSRQDDLLIAMQLDGKPAVPLPFGYKNGQIEPSSQGPGLQHPIRLDVNFRLPIQDLFRYGKNIQSFMENM